MLILHFNLPVKKGHSPCIFSLWNCKNELLEHKKKLLFLFWYWMPIPFYLPYLFLRKVAKFLCKSSEIWHWKIGSSSIRYSAVISLVWLTKIPSCIFSLYAFFYHVYLSLWSSLTFYPFYMCTYVYTSIYLTLFQSMPEFTPLF